MEQQVCGTRPTIFNELNQKKCIIENELIKLNEAIEALTKNPELATILEALNGVRNY